MSKFYDICARGQEKDGGGHFWDQVGMTLIVKPSDDGKARIYLKDHRTGMLYSAFERRAKDDAAAPQPKPSRDSAPADFNDDIPF